jgi:hypothetical protein
VPLASRLLIAVAVATLVGAVGPRPAQAMDGPFTWEEVLCQSDAAVEIEMFLATKTTRDHMEIRRVIWNRTKHRVRPMWGTKDIPSVTTARWELLDYLSNYRRDKNKSDPPPEWVSRLRRANERGSYRAMVFLEYYAPAPWVGGGVAYSGVEWLDHPDHAEWWAKIQPYLRQVIEASKRHEKPPFCADFKGDPNDVDRSAFKKWHF